MKPLAPERKDPNEIFRDIYLEAFDTNVKLQAIFEVLEQSLAELKKITAAKLLKSQGLFFGPQSK